MTDPKDPRELFPVYAGGEISARQLEVLEAALREDPDVRREFIEYMNIDSALGDLAALSEAEAAQAGSDATAPAGDVPATIARGGPRPARGFRRVVLAAGAAAALILAPTLWFFHADVDDRASVATVIATVDAELLRDDLPWRPPELQVGEYRLAGGLLHLRFEGGVMVYVEAPACFEVVNGRRLNLHGGRLSATVPPEGVGFAVDTPEAEIVDFGTEFCVDVDAEASEVHVFKGHVRVQPKSEQGGGAGRAVDLRTAQAVKIGDAGKKPVRIELATDRFIRNFDEPRQGYYRLVKRLSPLVAYRMAIRNKGLISDPPGHPGVILTGEGTRPPNARGAIGGGSMRVGANSKGRGARVDGPPPLNSGRFTLAVFAYLQVPAKEGTLATNIRGDRGNFSMSVDENGLVRATLRNSRGELQTVTGATPLLLRTWRYLVMTADGERLNLYEDGRLVSSAPAPAIAESGVDPLWFGTDAEGAGVWQGRLDEPALFDKALSGAEIANLYRSAAKELEGAK